MGKDKQRFIVILDGIDGFIPVRETFSINGRRRAEKLKRRLAKRKDIRNKRIKIIKDGLATQLREEFSFKGFT